MNPTLSERVLPPDPSWDEIAARAGIDLPVLAPGEHTNDVWLDLELYWPVGVDHPAQERRA